VDLNETGSDKKVEINYTLRSAIFVLFTKYYKDDKIKDNKMGDM
jgi:hypothetical protein